MDSEDDDSYWGKPIFPDDSSTWGKPLFSPSNPSTNDWKSSARNLLPDRTPSSCLPSTSTSTLHSKDHQTEFTSTTSLRLGIPYHFHAFLLKEMNFKYLTKSKVQINFHQPWKNKETLNVNIHAADGKGLEQGVTELKRCLYSFKETQMKESGRIAHVIRFPGSELGHFVGFGGHRAAKLRERHPKTIVFFRKECDAVLVSGDKVSVQSIVRELEDEMKRFRFPRPTTPPVQL